jgi:hypothetical protein
VSLFKGFPFQCIFSGVESNNPQGNVPFSPKETRVRLDAGKCRLRNGQRWDNIEESCQLSSAVLRHRDPNINSVLRGILEPVDFVSAFIPINARQAFKNGFLDEHG